MATKLYFPLDLTAPITPPVPVGSTTWEHINPSLPIRSAVTTADSSTLTTVSYVPDSADDLTDRDSCHRQYVYGPLAAQTFSGTVTGQFQGLEDHANNNLFLTLKIITCSAAGVLRNTLLAITRTTATEFITTIRNQTFNSVSLAGSQTCLDGDYLVIEVGLGGNVTTATGGVQGHNGSIRFGCNASSGDLPADNTQAGTTYRPWVNFSTTINLQVPVLSSQTVGSLTAVGGTPAVSTDIGNGTVYMVVVPNNDSPSVAQIKAGQNSSGAAALAAQNQAVSGSGTQTFAAVTGLVGATAYDCWFVQTAGNGADATAVKADFTTTTPSGDLTAGKALIAGLLLATGILMVSFAKPAIVTPVVKGATLTVTGGGPSTFDMGTGLSRSNGIAQPATIKIKPVATASVATARLPGAFLGGKVALTGLTRSNGVGTAQLSTHFPTTQIGTGLSLANARALGSPPKSLLTPAPSRATDRLRSSLNLIRYATPVRDTPLATAQLSTHFPTTSIGTGLSRDSARLRSTGILFVYKATPIRASARLAPVQFSLPPNFSMGTGISRQTDRLRASLNLFAKVTPSRDVARAGPATIRFVGAGFDMGAGISRAEGRLKPTGILLIYKATPIRSGTLRMWGPPALWYSSQPIAVSGRAWAAGPLGMVGQQYLPDYSRASGGRVISLHIRLMSAVSPIEAHTLAKATLQFSGGPKVQIAGLSRSTSWANGQQLQVTLTNRIGLDGRSRSNGLLTGAFLKQYYHVTPSKLDPRVTAWLHTHQEVAPVRHAGIVRCATTLSVSLKQNIAGTTRQTSRVPGAFLKIKPALVGVSLNGSRLTAPQPNHKLVLSLAPSREVARSYSAVLQFTGGSTITLGPAPVRATSRVIGPLSAFFGAMPIMGNTRLTAQLSGKQVLIGTLRSTTRVRGQLGVTAPAIIGLEGRTRSTIRLSGYPKTINAGGRILSGSGRLVGTTLTQAIALPGRSLLHPRAVAVLAFTGAVVQPVSGRLLGDSRALATLKTIYRAAPIRAQAVTTGVIRTIIPLRGTTLDTALLTGEFPNPYELATILNACRVSCAFLRSASPLGGYSRATGAVLGGLTVHGQVAARIFFAKNRVFVWLAHDRDFVIDAKDRRFIFYAGGLA